MAQSLTGKFLLASNALLDPNFLRTVVLIVRHDDEGAFGLVVNRPMSITVGTALSPVIEEANSVEDPVYFGGPCQGPVFVMHGDSAIGGESPVEGVYVTTDREAIEALLASGSEPIKFFASYSGWTKGQLESELGENSWLVCDAGIGEIFAVGDNLWSRLHTQVNLSKYVNPDLIPDDPTVN